MSTESPEVQELLDAYYAAFEHREAEINRVRAEYVKRKDELIEKLSAAYAVKIGDHVKITGGFLTAYQGKTMLVDRIDFTRRLSGIKILLGGIILKKDGNVGKIRHSVLAKYVTVVEPTDE